MTGNYDGDELKYFITSSVNNIRPRKYGDYWIDKNINRVINYTFNLNNGVVFNSKFYT